MADILKKGTPVHIKRTMLAGTVKQAAIVNDDQMQYLVGYQDEEDGKMVAKERWTPEAELEVVDPVK